MTRPQDRNLRRGRATPEEQRASIAVAREAKAEQEAEDERIGALAADDRYAYLRALHQAMASNLAAALRREARSGRGEVTRNVTDRARELRALSLELKALEEARGGVDAQARAFLAIIEGRLGGLADVIRDHGVTPVVEPA